LCDEEDESRPGRLVAEHYEEGDDQPDPATRCLGHRGVWVLDVSAGTLIDVPAAQR